MLQASLALLHPCTGLPAPIDDPWHCRQRGSYFSASPPPPPARRLHEPPPPPPHSPLLPALHVHGRLPQHLAPAHLPQEPNAESRAAVQGGKPVTPAGPVALDPEPDIREVLLLADELRLDEVLAVLCVQGALQEVRLGGDCFGAGSLPGGWGLGRCR